MTHIPTIKITDNKKVIEHIQNTNTKLIYIAGASASGKSYFAKKLATQLKKQQYKVLEISSDDYYNNETNLQYLLYGSFDHPKLIDYPLLQKNINEYFKTGSTKIPQYSFIERRRIGYTPIDSKQQEYDYIIVEGLYTINQLKNTHRPFKIFVNSPNEELIFRRIIRDQQRVHESIDTIVSMIGKVFPMRKIYGETQKQDADIIIDNDYKIMEKEGKIHSFKLLKEKPKNIGKLIKKEYIYDYIYDDQNHNNGVIYLSEVYSDNPKLIDYVIITKSKHQDYHKESYNRIIIKLYEPGSLTMIHTLLQTAGLQLIETNKKIEYQYKNTLGNTTKLKRSRNKRYLIK